MSPGRWCHEHTRVARTLAILLVPGYWLGAWARDAVIAQLTERGYRAEALTLPGLEAESTTRASVRFSDHVKCVARRVNALGGRVVLVTHSGAGAIATAVADQMPDALARVVYVDSGPVAAGTVPRPDLTPADTELPFPGFDALAAQGASSEGLSDLDKAQMEARAVAHPAGACREPIVLHNPRRNAVPTTLVCCSIPGNAVQEMAASGFPMFAALGDVSDLTLIDLPTGHWPMFSRPDDLADLIATQSSRA